MYTFFRKKKAFQFVYAGYFWESILVAVSVLLQREEIREAVLMACKALEIVALDIFVNNGYREASREYAFDFSYLYTHYSFMCARFSSLELCKNVPMCDFRGRE